ncbi:fatty acid desaturase [Dinoroseobacter sp. S76]|uniref:fatty acid desaturase n=1 Tax=Dinoroseobacter sp. S76 TaxID=3415124 RepID=UPI003C7A9978
MTFQTTLASPAPVERSAQDWVRILAAYRTPNTARSIFELGVTLGGFLALWALAVWALQSSVLLAMALAMINGIFLVRLFIIQHDCGHGSYFQNRKLADWLGRSIGVLTLTPYDYWRRTHAIHHSASGNLDARGIGDVTTLTVAEYKARGALGKLKYRAYRHPLTLFGIGPIYQFFIQHRLPIGLMRAGARYWISAMGTNLALACLIATIWYLGGSAVLLAIYVPTGAAAAALGVWLFYVQHQFETTHWEDGEEWQLHEAALAGSSHYDLPAPLRWLTGNIGIHHVHHLYSRIPFYRLTEVLRDHGALVEISRLTLWESFGCARLHLWDENSRRLVSFRQARAL